MFPSHARTSVGARYVLSALAILALLIATFADIRTALALRNGLDPSFVAFVGDTADWTISDLALQPDGKILVGGVYGNANGQSSFGLVRLNPDGSTDSSFNPPSLHWVTDIDLLPNGKMYVSVADGYPVFGTSEPQVFRLNSNGSLDTSFNAPTFNQELELRAARIEALPDGRLYLETVLADQPAGVPSFAGLRLNTDGSVDTSFNVGGKYPADVRLVDSQGRTYFSGLVNSANEVGAPLLGRLRADGTLDPNFNAPTVTEPIWSVTEQADGKLLIALTNYDYLTSVIRLNSDGSRDTGFSYTAPAEMARSLAIATLPDGRFVVSGNRTDTHDEYVWRFLANGAPDPSFEPFPIYLAGGKGGITVMLAQPDGKLLLGGRFDEIGIPPRRGVVRLLADTSPAPSGPAACATKRFYGDGSGSWGDDSRTFYDEGTTFTLSARSISSARALVFIESSAITTLSSIGSKYTAPRLTQYTVNFASSTDNTRANWVDVAICAPANPAPTPSPTTCALTRFYGDASGSWGKYSTQSYPAGTTFTLSARSTSAARGMVFVSSNAVTYLDNLGSSYAAPSQASYSVGFSSASANTSANWVEIKVCAPGGSAPTPSPTPALSCTTKRFYGDGSGSWGTYSRATYPAGTTFTLSARSTSAARGMVFVDANAISYLGDVGSKYSAPNQSAYNVGFNSTTANSAANWVDIAICTPGSAQALALDEVLLGDEVPEPAALEDAIFLPLLGR